MASSSVDSPSPSHLQGGRTSLMGSSSLCSPSSDKRFWSNLRGRVDVLLEERSCKIQTKKHPLTDLDPDLVTQANVSKSERAKRLKEDSLLLFRGFDSIGQTLSQLSNTLENALQGAKDLAKPPTMTEIYLRNLKKSEAEEEEDSGKEKENEESNTGGGGGMKRKFDNSHCPEEDSEEATNEQNVPTDNIKFKKAKNLAITMASKASFLALELKSLKSNPCFMQERYSLLEEENRKLCDGFENGIRPDEDDLVRLQLEALLSEKSRLANENANLVRENQCLHQLVKYHQLTSHDLSESYEQGLCLDLSSPIPEGKNIDEEEDDDDISFSGSLDHKFQEEDQ